MKKSLVTIAMGTALLAPGAAMADTKVYGKFNIGLDQQKDEIGFDFNNAGETTWKLRDNNNSSRLGFKGSEDLGLGELKVIYQLEYGIDPDGSEGAPFSERNIFLGLQGDFGAVRFGKYDTPVKDIGGNIDQFNDTVGDITNLMVGETRANNMIKYTSPKLGEHLELAVAIQPGEHRAATDDAADFEDGLTDTTYLSLTYGSSAFDVGVAYAMNEVAGAKFDGVGASGTATKAVDILRGTAMFKLSSLELGVLFQSAEGTDRTGDATAVNGSDAKETSILGSVGYTLEAFKFKAQYGQTDGDSTDAKRTELAAGVDYKLSKSAVTQAYFVTQKQDNPAGADAETRTLGVALVFSF